MFLRTLAHDLKTPLAALAWHVQMLKARLREQGNDDIVALTNIEAIEQAVAETMASMNELHDQAGPASLQRGSLICDTVDLVSLIGEMVDMRRQSSSHPWLFASTRSSAVVRGDRARLRRVFDNLFENASKYSGLEQPVEVCIARDRSFALVFVQDSGAGIPDTDLPYIFEPYYRGHNAVLAPGEGLGLASVRQLVALHGGAVEVHSRQEAGSIFTVRLPLAVPV